MSKKATNSILFKGGWTAPLLRGFRKQRTTRYVSNFNEMEKPIATLFNPIIKALILYTCNGNAMFDDSLTFEDYENGRGVVAGVGELDKLIIAEYHLPFEMTQIAVFDTEKKEFLFAGVTSDNENFNSYCLDFKTNDGTVLWLCLIHYLKKTAFNSELVDVFTNLNFSDMTLNYRKILKGEQVSLEKYLEKYCFILCDNLYRCLDNDNSLSKIEVNLPSSGMFPNVPLILTDGAYKCDSVISGNFTVNGLASETQKESKPSKEITPQDIQFKYSLNENLSDEEKSLVPLMYDGYVVPKFVLKAAHNIWFHHKNPNIMASMKQNNLLLFGEPGGGKTDGAIAIGSTLGLPVVRVSLSANSDETDFTGKIFPDFEEDTKSDNLTFGYNSLSELLEFAEISPEIVYKDITGVDKEDATYEDVIFSYANETAKRQNQSSKGISYKFVSSDFIKAIENGWLCIIEEPTNVRDQGVQIILNSLMDGYQEITLPTGKIIKRNPNTVIVFACNVDEVQGSEFESSTLSRMNPKYRVEAPDKSELIKRVSNMTGFRDYDKLSLMANVCINLRNYIKEHALVGLCGVREFAGWVLQYIANVDFDEKATLREAALETIVPSASPHEEDMVDIIRDVIDTMLPNTI